MFIKIITIVLIFFIFLAHILIHFYEILQLILNQILFSLSWFIPLTLTLSSALSLSLYLTPVTLPVSQESLA